MFRLAFMQRSLLPVGDRDRVNFHGRLSIRALKSTIVSSSNRMRQDSGCKVRDNFLKRASNGALPHSTSSRSETQSGTSWLAGRKPAKLDMGRLAPVLPDVHDRISGSHHRMPVAIRNIFAAFPCRGLWLPKTLSDAR
jgi:hypothetical protein